VPTLLCFGLGYCGERLARRLTASGWHVQALVREPASRAPVPGVELLPFDRPAPLAGATHLLSAVPPGPPAASDPVLDLLAERADDLAGLEWAGYLSSTAVYGDRGGAWVDAATEPRPGGPRGEARLAAERGWLALPAPLQVFRLAGIYGPGRSALDAVRAGRARRIDKPGHVFSRVHVDDIVEALLASIARPRPGAVYDLADEAPAPHDEVVAAACELLGVPPPPLEAWDDAAPTLSPALREFYADCRRVSSARTRAELDLTLRYPDHRAGLRAILEEEERCRRGR
jgi:nucleoside-diphosphate-sugar epimerase